MISLAYVLSVLAPFAIAAAVFAWRRHRKTITGEVQRLPRRPRLPLFALMLACAACAACVDAPTRARQDYSAALRVASAAQARLRSWDAQRQAEIVRSAPSAEAGRASLAAYRARRAAVVEKARETEAVMDQVADELLLSDGQAAPLAAAARARQAAQELRQAVQALQMEATP